MKTVTVRKVDLLETLKENKKTHVEDFEITWEAYQEAVISNMEKLLKRAKKAPKWEAIEVYVGLQAPENHESDYQRAIEMLAWEVGDEVELTEGEFKQYVQDDWSWKGIVAASNTMYTGSASPSKLSVK